jgi:hypothetical protein
MMVINKKTELTKIFITIQKIEKVIKIIPVFFNLIMRLGITVIDDTNRTYSARSKLFTPFLRRAEGVALTFA